MLEGNWFAVYTRPGRERKLADLLTKKKIRNYFPLNRVLRESIDRKKTVYEPLIPCYVFIYLSKIELLTLNQNISKLNFMYWRGKPATIKNEEIEGIKHFLEEYSFVKIEIEKVPVNPCEHARIINGPTVLRKGNILEVRKSLVKIILPSLGYVLIADLRSENMDAITYSEESVIKDIIS